MKRRWLWWLIAIMLGGCASAPDQPTMMRQALVGLSDRAARLVLADPVWDLPTADVVVLLAPPEVDEQLGIGTERFHENLSRALLAQQEGPQLLDWTPAMDSAEAPANQWLLECRLAADGPRLRLSDRELLPYRLTLSLRRPGDGAPRWQQHISGAIDASAL
ncbi:hypothetical protein [Litchfieldella rifensis]|uniref:Lipoprotein n=1 Tax=Litchfieldella rifensis TaxID=762643 RepID=A0ABV7LTC7_9GAMM